MAIFCEAIRTPLLLSLQPRYDLTPASPPVAAFCRRLALAVRTEHAGASTPNDACDAEVDRSRKMFDAFDKNPL